MGDVRLQDRLEWLFLPLIVALTYAASQASGVVDGVLLTLCLAIIVSGWISFRAAGRAVYSDGIFALDVCLLVAYGLLVISVPCVGRVDGTQMYWIVSAVINLLYAGWDFRVFLATRNDGKTATDVSDQFLRFGVATLGCAMAFGLVAGFQSENGRDLGCADIVGAALWLVLLLAWHGDRLIKPHQR